jgi:hypothetical protein
MTGLLSSRRMLLNEAREVHPDIDEADAVKFIDVTATLVDCLVSCGYRVHQDFELTTLGMLSLALCDGVIERD